MDTILYLSLYYLVNNWYICQIRPSSVWRRCWGLL